MSQLKNSSLCISTNCHLLGGFHCSSWAGWSWLSLVALALCSLNLTLFYRLCLVLLLPFCLFSCFSIEGANGAQSMACSSHRAGEPWELRHAAWSAASRCQLLGSPSSCAAARDCLMVLAGTGGKNHFSDLNKTSDLEMLYKSPIDFNPVQILKETVSFPLNTMALYSVPFYSYQWDRRLLTKGLKGKCPTPGNCRPHEPSTHLWTNSFVPGGCGYISTKCS